MMFQNAHLFPSLTAQENVEIPLRLALAEAVQREKLANDALKRVGLALRAHHRGLELSGGEQQRVALARALVHSPRFIVADEPTGNLDAASAQEVLTIMTRLNKEYGKTVVMVTHDPHAAKYATKVHYLEKGELVGENVAPA